MSLQVQIVPQRAMTRHVGAFMRPRTRLRRLGLGAITPQNAAQQASAGIRTPARILSDITNAATIGTIIPYSGANPAECAKAGNASSVKGSLTKAGSGIALNLVTAGTVAGPAAPFVIAAGAILGVFSAIFNHHALAVAREEGTLCAAVPAANAAVGAIDGAVQSGQISPDVGAASLQNVLSEFDSTVAPIRKMDSGHCNAACVITEYFRAIVAVKVSQYQDMSAQQAAAAAAAAAQQAKQAAATSPAQAVATGSAPPAPLPIVNPVAAVQTAVTKTAASIGVPSWALYAATAAALFLLVRR